MNRKIEMIKGFRIYLLRQIESLSVRQLNNIPAGFNNNIIWNLAHLIATQQTICYLRANQPATVEERYISSYMTGTKPGNPVDENEIKIIIELLINSIDQLQSDFDKKIFEQYTASVMIPKVYGFEVTNINQALVYLLYHEGLHSGYILAMKRLL